MRALRLVILCTITCSTFGALVPHDWKNRIDGTVLEARESERTIADNSSMCDMVPVNNITYTGKLERRNFWPNRDIPYVINDALRRTYGAVIEPALRSIFTRTQCIKFKPRTGERDYIAFLPARREDRCESVVGRQCGEQRIRLGARCMTQGIIQHEVLHSLGVFHEQNRPDRNSHVEIFEDNIHPDALALNFAIMKDMPTEGTYDLRSIMHYGAYDFAKNPREPTIIPLKGRDQKMGQREGLSPYDVAKLSIMYGCFKSGETQPKTDDPLTQHFSRVFSTAPVTEAESSLSFPEHCNWVDDKDQSANPCSDFKGLGIFYTTNVNKEPFKRLTTAISQTPPRPLKMHLSDGSHISTDVFNSVRLRLVILTVSDCRDAHVTQRISALNLENLLDYQLFICENLVIRKAHFSNMQLLRILRFRETSIRSIEVGTFADLPNLRVFALEYMKNEKIELLLDEDKEYLRKVHCSCEFGWLRRWLGSKRYFLEAKDEGEVYNLTESWYSDAVLKEEIYIPVDCSDLESTIFSQIPFSFNEDRCA